MSHVLADMISGNTPEAPHANLSDREFQVFKRIAMGEKLSEIAKALALSPKTVSVYRGRVLEKLHLENNVDIARYAVKNGLVDPL
jgi:DNA-binding NarL/FixJ family response regulator